MSSKTAPFEFRLRPGQMLSRYYEVVEMLGSGWEGEVYLVRETSTGIERTAKLFFPERNRGDRTATRYARKLNTLRHCPIVIQYHTQMNITLKGVAVTMLISEFVEGELLSQFLARQPGRRLPPFQAVHLLHALARGMETIHAIGEYHGDLHSENVIIQRYGLSFDVKLVDMYHWGPPSPANIKEDVIDLVRLLYEAIGGRKHYAKQPAAIKSICCGLKRSMITRKFRSAGALRQHLEMIRWD
ncbi:MAG: protein kinase [Thiogranum sp.]|nr:protein kinase [Thiogranum sp.]